MGDNLNNWSTSIYADEMAYPGSPARVAFGPMDQIVSLETTGYGSKALRLGKVHFVSKDKAYNPM